MARSRVWATQGAASKCLLRALAVVAILSIWPPPAGAITVDFEGFALGPTTLAVLNTALAGLGIQFDAIEPTTLEIQDDPLTPGNHVLFASTNPAGADILALFTSPLSLVNGRFPDNPGGPFFVTVSTYDHTGTAGAIQGTLSNGFANGFEPGILPVVITPIRAAQFESASPGIYIDDINFVEAAPEPGTLFLLGAGLSGLGILARRRFPHAGQHQ